jgi:hypothetical protein
LSGHVWLRSGGRGRIVATVALMAVLTSVAALAIPSAASALTGGFDVFNLSSYKLKLVAVEGDRSFESSPDIGSVMNLASSQHAEVNLWAFTVQRNTFSYDAIAPDGSVAGRVRVQFELTSGGAQFTYCVSVQGPLRCETGGSSRRAEILDPPGTVHEIPPREGQAQAEVLSSLCIADTSAKCAFTPTRQDSVISPTHPVGNELVNNTDQEQETRVEIRDRVGWSNSVGLDVEVGGELFEVVKVSVTAKYEHEWTGEHTFIQEVTVHCRPLHRCWIMATAPLLRSTGDFTLKLANTTWHLRDVYFDTPDPNGSGAYKVNEVPLTPSERESLGPHARTIHVIRGRFTTPSEDQPTVARPSLHLSVDGPASVRAGSNPRFSLILGRTQPRGHVTYRLGQVAVTEHAGRITRRLLTSASAPGSSRRLRFRIRVPRRANGEFCLHLNASAKHARGAHARRCVRIR